MFRNNITNSTNNHSLYSTILFSNDTSELRSTDGLVFVKVAAGPYHRFSLEVALIVSYCMDNR